MKYFQRMAMLIAATLVMSLVVAQLGRTPWAQGIRDEDARYRARHQRPPAPAAVNRPLQRLPLRSYYKPLVKPVMSILIPAMLTQLVLVVLRFRRE